MSKIAQDTKTESTKSQIPDVLKACEPLMFSKREPQTCVIGLTQPLARFQSLGMGICGLCPGTKCSIAQNSRDLFAVHALTPSEAQRQNNRNLVVGIWNLSIRQTLFFLDFSKSTQGRDAAIPQ